jgi:Acetyltransferase (GNAT) domain
MNGHSSIQYLLHNEIDKIKWDQCIDSSSNGLIYGYSFYLDHMAKKWDALVLNDYEAVMPLTWNRKYGIAYLYQPFLTAQLGVFGNAVSGELLENFLEAIPSKYQYLDFYLNHQNVFPSKKFHLYQRSNYVLDLEKPYQDVYSGYRENIQRNIRRAEQTGCKPVKDFDAEKVIGLAVQQMKTYTKESAGNVDRFRQLYKVLHPQKKAISYGILSSKDELLASCVFLYSHNRAYYILVGNHPDGRTIGASHALIDAFIKDHAGKKIMLDFEGSDIRNLAFFYSSFGAVEEKFAGIKLNRLPFYLKWLKS